MIAVAGSRSWGSDSGSTPDTAQQQQAGDEMAKVRPAHWKRTMPFQPACGFMFENAEGMIERCDEKSDFALYFDYNTSGLGIINLCHYHTRWQENQWTMEAGE